MALDLTKIPILSPCGGTPLERGLEAQSRPTAVPL